MQTLVSMGNPMCDPSKHPLTQTFFARHITTLPTTWCFCCIICENELNIHVTAVDRNTQWFTILPPPRRLWFYPCPYVCWLVCQQDYTKAPEWISTTLGWRIDRWVSAQNWSRLVLIRHRLRDFLTLSLTFNIFPPRIDLGEKKKKIWHILVACICAWEQSEHMDTGLSQQQTTKRQDGRSHVIQSQRALCLPHARGGGREGRELSWPTSPRPRSSLIRWGRPNRDLTSSGS